MHSLLWTNLIHFTQILLFIDFGNHWARLTLIGTEVKYGMIGLSDLITVGAGIVIALGFTTVIIIGTTKL